MTILGINIDATPNELVHVTPARGHYEYRTTRLLHGSNLLVALRIVGGVWGMAWDRLG